LPQGLHDDIASVEFARGQQRALELVATGAPLEDVLEHIIDTIEEHCPGVRGSVLLLPDGTHVRHGAAPSLPALADSSFPADRLMFELTETALVDDAASVRSGLWLSVNVSGRQVVSDSFVATVAALATITALAEMGILLALDDFGTGFSSLRHILRFPIHALKIDRSFVSALPGSPRARAVVAAINAMAHELDKVVIAEGVEESEQLECVTELGCDYAQGYLLGRPAPGEVVL
jgi:EAL domain-containing protein (putative c-di-GMP-specific phosphodiesterase class I)